MTDFVTTSLNPADISTGPGNVSQAGQQSTGILGSLQGLADSILTFKLLNNSAVANQLAQTGGSYPVGYGQTAAGSSLPSAAVSNGTIFGMSPQTLLFLAGAVALVAYAVHEARA